MTLYVSASEAKSLLGISDSLELCEKAFALHGQGQTVSSSPSATFMIVKNDPQTIFWLKAASVMPLSAAGVHFGAQFGDYYFMVSDSRTGMLRGIVDQAWLTKRRTATAGVVAALKLARKGAKVAALIGAGQIGDEVARVLSHAFKLEDFRVASRTLEGASAFVERLQPEIDAPMRAVSSAEEAIRGADIVITITLASAAFVKAGWLKEGAVLVSMGGVHEVEYEVLAEIDRVVVDDPDYALLKGDFSAWVERGEIEQQAMRDRIDANLGEVVCGSKPGRESDSQRILAVVQGMCICDVAQAVFIIEKAQETGVGQSFTVERQMEAPEIGKLKPRAASIASDLQRRRPGPVTT